MQLPVFSRKISRSFKPITGFVVGIVLLFAIQSVRADFGSVFSNAGPETVKLVRKLPPVTERRGRTVRFEPEIASSSFPMDTAIILREKIRTLLLRSKEGEIQLVDGPANTVLRCTLTSYEPRTQSQNQRQVGLKQQQLLTLRGSIEASVQVLDEAGRPLDAANLKGHLEKDYVVWQHEDNVTPLNSRSTASQKIGGLLRTLGGGKASAADVAGLAGAGAPVRDALKNPSSEKLDRVPSDAEWRSELIEGMASKVANRIVAVDEEFVAMLPSDHDFAPAREVAKAGRWGDVQEKLETAGTMPGRAEAYRQYFLGLSFEALAYEEEESPNKAAETLNRSSQKYTQAANLLPNEREFLLAQIRVQDSLDHYLEIQHYAQTRKQQPALAPATNVQSDTSSASADIPNNSALIEMVKTGMAEGVMLSYVNTASNPKFDVSATGLMNLARGKVPSRVIQAVQQRMYAERMRAPARRNMSVPRPVPQ